MSWIAEIISKIFLWILERFIYYAKGRSDQKRKDQEASHELSQKAWQDVANSRTQLPSPLYRVHDGAGTIQQIPPSNDPSRARAEHHPTSSGVSGSESRGTDGPALRPSPAARHVRNLKRAPRTPKEPSGS